MYFSSPFQSVQVSAPHKAMPQLYHFISFFLKLKSNFLVKSLLPVESRICHGNLAFDFTCTSCLNYYYATQIVKYSTFLQLLMYNNLHWEWLPWNSHRLSFLYFNFHSIAPSNFC
jgi:hypothetical protein